MDLAKMLLQLRAELDNINAAIISLERLQQGGRRRGRPPEYLSDLKKLERVHARKTNGSPGPPAKRKN
jgi:hypothetical protein